MNKKSGWIGVDLDGTLAHYEKWEGENHIGEPLWPMVERVKGWLRDGYTVKILTARVGGHPRASFSPEEVTKSIQDWCEEHIGERLPVTCKKDFGMIELWDDRCVQVELNVGEPVAFWQSRV